MNDGPSDRYDEALRRTRAHHATHKTFSGQFSWKQRRRIKDLIDRFEVKTLLDYGCGKGKQYRNVDEETGQSLEQFWGLTTTKYDPGVPEFNTEPAGAFDMAICVQVLSSIPTADLPWVIDRLYGFATRVIFTVERIKLPKKRLFTGMEAEMPHRFDVDDWLRILRRPGSPVTLVSAFHNEDPTRGWEGWKIVEPNEQGASASGGNSALPLSEV